MIIHAPTVNLDLIYNDTVIGGIDTQPFVVSPGITSFDTALFFPRSAVNTTAQLAYDLGHGQSLFLTLAGSRSAPQDCLLQRLLRNVSVSVDVASNLSSPARRREVLSLSLSLPLSLCLSSWSWLSTTGVLLLRPPSRLSETQRKRRSHLASYS